MESALSLALSTLQSLGLMPYIQASIIIMLVGGFLAIVFNRGK